MMISPFITCVQETCSKQDVAELQEMLQLKEALLMNFQKELFQREKEIMDLRSKYMGTAKVRN